MKKLNNVVKILSLIFLLCQTLTVSAVKLGEVKSPGEKIRVELNKETDGKLYYQVFLNNTLVIQPSETNISVGNNVVSLCTLSNCEFTGVDTQAVEDDYQMISGKKSTNINRYNELTASFSQAAYSMKIIFRVYDEGVAFKYDIGGSSTRSMYITSETSRINVNNCKTSWAQKYVKGADYSEYYFTTGKWNEMSAQNEFFAPILMLSDENNYFLLTEAQNEGNYPASKFIASETTGSFYLSKVGDAVMNLPFVSPWRVIMLGDLPTIMESTLVENLNPPAMITDLSWIKPGRSSWSWGGEDAGNAINMEVIKRYIDYSHEMNWEYFLLDDGWENSGVDFTLKEVVDYANSKDVGILLWSGSGKFQNDETQIRNRLKPWADLGIKGVKIDFFNSDAQSMMQKYDKLYKITAEQKLLLNLHGCTKPSGRIRTWPHILTMEAVYGGEMYVFVSTSTPAHHNINVTMTRNVIGSMDYTPGDFANKRGQVRQLTTWSHQMALLTAFESGIQHFVDRPQNYNYHIGEQFFKILPVTWDDIKVLEAQPDQYVTIGRKKGDDWYIASLCNAGRTVEIPLDFLEEGKNYYAYIYKDGTCKTDIQFEFKENLNKNSSLSLALKNTGGATIHISTSPDFPRPEVKIYEAEASGNTKKGVQTWNDNDGLCSGNQFIGNVGNGNSVTFNNVTAPVAGKYAVTVFYMSMEQRDIQIKINGDNATKKTVSCNNTDGWEGKGLGYTTIVLDLKEGSNSMEIGNDNAWAPNIDRIAVQKAIKEPSDISAIPSQSLLPAEAFGSKGGVKINTEEPLTYKILDISGNEVSRGSAGCGFNNVPVKIPGVYVVQLFSSKANKAVKVVVE